MGVDTVVSSTAYIAEMISHEVDWTGVNRMLERNVGNVRIRDLLVGKTSQANGKSLSDITLPGGTILITVVRNQEALIPNGQTRIEAGDRVIALSHDENATLLSDFFTGIAGRYEHEE